MEKPKILIVEDDSDISNMLKMFFEREYEVVIAMGGREALEKTRTVMPNLIILDIMLPDINGYEVCRELRTHSRTSFIPIIFLTQKDDLSDKLQGLELGADDYITKPFDFGELRLRIKNAIAHAERETYVDPHSGLPSGRQIEESLREVMLRDDWALMDIEITHLKGLNDAYGFLQGNEVLRLMGLTLNNVLNEIGTLDDFAGHAGSTSFVVITKQELAQRIFDTIRDQFLKKAHTFYSFIDRDQGYVVLADGVQVPLVDLSVGIVSPSTHDFSDIREITELAAEERRRNAAA
ncbi:MAG: response regulator [Anaerolineae bacterium]|jgi:DNA-binding response OmpR family regulator|nr:response regulator [Anaerolineae bacterium]